MRKTRLYALTYATLIFANLTFVEGSAVADESADIVFSRLQKEPMTLFDAGMKSLRRLALDTSSVLSAPPDMDVTSLVSYNATVNQIEILYHVSIEDAKSLESLNQQCIAMRKNAILKMFRIGLTDYTIKVSVNDRIRRRIGGQFAHEPIGTFEDTIRMGELLAPNTFVSVKLETKKEPTINITCRALATDSMKEAANP